MKILYIINSLGTGGAEKLVTDMLPLIKQKGHQPEILLLNDTDSGIFLKQLSIHDIKIHISPYSMYSYKNIYYIRTLLKKFDVGHAHLFPTQYWVALTFSKTPVLVTEHCTTNRRRKNLIFWPIERFTYGRYKKIITISEKANKTLSKWLKMSENNLVVINNGINLNSFFDAKSSIIKEIPLKAKKVIMVGRFNATKDQPTAIKAMSLLPDDVHLILVGEGNLIDSCKRLASESKVAERVHFLGRRGDIPALLKSCDLNLISSHSEGLSISSLEALASGRPLITSNVNGLREINQGVGLLFEDSNEKELANCILTLLKNKELYKKIVEKSIARAKQYDISITVDSHLRQYKSLIKA